MWVEHSVKFDGNHRIYDGRLTIRVEPMKDANHVQQAFNLAMTLKEWLHPETWKELKAYLMEE